MRGLRRACVGACAGVGVGVRGRGRGRGASHPARFRKWSLSSREMPRRVVLGVGWRPFGASRGGARGVWPVRCGALRCGAGLRGSGVAQRSGVRSDREMSQRVVSFSRDAAEGRLVLARCLKGSLSFREMPRRVVLGGGWRPFGASRGGARGVWPVRCGAVRSGAGRGCGVWCGAAQRRSIGSRDVAEGCFVLARCRKWSLRFREMPQRVFSVVDGDLLGHLVLGVRGVWSVRCVPVRGGAVGSGVVQRSGVRSDREMPQLVVRFSRDVAEGCFVLARCRRGLFRSREMPQKVA